MESLQSKSLENIEISNYATDDSFLVADNDFSNMLNFNFFFPLLFLCIFTIASFFYPNSTSIQTDIFNFNNKTGYNLFTISFNVSKISPIIRYMHANFSLVNPIEKVDYSAQSTAVLYKRSNIVNMVDHNFTSKSTIPSIPILDEDSIYFDSLRISIILTTKVHSDEKYSLTLSSMSSQFQICIIFCRISFSLFLLTYSIFIILNFTCWSTERPTFETNYTIALSFFTILFNNPFNIIQLFNPSPYNQLVSIVLRDLYLSFILSYIFAIFSFFGEHVESRGCLQVSFPIFIFFVSLGILLWLDISSSLIDQTALNENISLHHYLYLIISTILILIRIIVSYCFKSEPQAQRFRIYTISTLFTLCSISFFALYKYFSEKINDGFNLVFPMALFTAYALFMQYMHESSTINDVYVPQENTAKEDNQIGIDADPEQLNKDSI